jgi:hypothetical protein
MKTQAIREPSYAQLLYVLCWRQTCCLLKSAQEGTFAHAGLCSHRGDTQADHIRVLEPLLNLKYGFVAVVQLWREVQSQIDPSHEATRRNDVPVIDDRFFGIDPNVGESLSERL